MSLLALLAFLAPFSAFAAPPVLDMQGALKNGGGPLVDGTYAVTLSIYADAAGGDALWFETAGLPVKDGVFQARLGDKVALPTAIFAADSTLFVGVQFESEPELPRQPFASVAYALSAQSAELAGTALVAETLSCTGCVSAGALAFTPVTQADVDNAIAAAIADIAPPDPKPALVERTKSAFEAGTPDKVVVGGTQTAPRLELAGGTGTVDLGDGSDGELIVSGVKVDDGSPKQYTAVTIKAGGVVKVAPWSGAAGGKLTWRVQGAVTIETGGVVDVSASGFRGGKLSLNTSCPGAGVTGFDGESVAGTGDQDNGANGGGGGAGQLGSTQGSAAGGGSYGTKGGPGNSVGNGNNPGQPGNVYGDAQLTDLLLGSGGGTGGMDGNGTCPRQTGPGGNGGGALRIVAKTISINGEVRADGQDGTASKCNSGSCGSADDGGSGGGSGGSVHLRAQTLTVAGLVSAAGGQPGNGHHDTSSTSGQANVYRGGPGGNGRIRLDAVTSTIAGAVTPTAGFTELLSADDFAGTEAEGTFTSQVLDAGAATDWGSVGWETYGGPHVEVQVRSAATSNMAGAADFATAPLVTLGQDLSTVSSVSDGDRFLQYRVRLVSGAGTSPVFTAVAINRQ